MSTSLLSKRIRYRQNIKKKNHLHVIKKLLEIGEFYFKNLITFTSLIILLFNIFLKLVMSTSYISKKDKAQKKNVK